MSFRAGHICWFDFHGAEGSEPSGQRPGIIVQDDQLPKLDTILVVPCTGELRRRRQPTCVFLPRSQTGFREDSVAVCHLLWALDKQRILGNEPAGQLSARCLIKVRLMLAVVLGIDMQILIDDEAGPAVHQGGLER